MVSIIVRYRMSLTAGNVPDMNGDTIRTQPMLTDVTIRVPDPELAAEFYVLLGGDPDPFEHLVWFGMTAVQLWKGAPASRVDLSINVPDVTEVADRLERNGHIVRWSHPNRSVFTTRDPDDNSVLIRSWENWQR